MDISMLLTNPVVKFIWWLLPLIGSLSCLYFAWRLARYLYLTYYRYRLKTFSYNNSTPKPNTQNSQENQDDYYDGKKENLHGCIISKEQPNANKTPIIVD